MASSTSDLQGVRFSGQDVEHHAAMRASGDARGDLVAVDVAGGIGAGFGKQDRLGRIRIPRTCAHTGLGNRDAIRRGTVC